MDALTNKAKELGVESEFHHASLTAVVMLSRLYRACCFCESTSKNVGHSSFLLLPRCSLERVCRCDGQGNTAHIVYVRHPELCLPIVLLNGQLQSCAQIKIFFQNDPLREFRNEFEFPRADPHTKEQEEVRVCCKLRMNEGRAVG